MEGTLHQDLTAVGTSQKALYYTSIVITQLQKIDAGLFETHNRTDVRNNTHTFQGIRQRKNGWNRTEIANSTFTGGTGITTPIVRNKTQKESLVALCEYTIVAIPKKRQSRVSGGNMRPL